MVYSFSIDQCVCAYEFYWSLLHRICSIPLSHVPTYLCRLCDYYLPYLLCLVAAGCFSFSSYFSLSCGGDLLFHPVLHEKYGLAAILCPLLHLIHSVPVYWLHSNAYMYPFMGQRSCSMKGLAIQTSCMAVCEWPDHLCRLRT